MKCEDAKNLVIDSLSGQIEESERRSLADHLESCERCVREAEELGGLWADLGRITVAEPADRMAKTFAETARFPPERLSWLRLGSRGWGLAARVAAAAMLILVGGGAGFLGARLMGARSASGDDEIADGRFILLLRGNEPEVRHAEEFLVEEYRSWAGRLASDGMLMAAEKLGDEPGRWVASPASADVVDGPVSAESLPISGFFIVHAADYDAAERIARESPHIRFGGVIELRRIDVPGERDTDGRPAQ